MAEFRIRIAEPDDLDGITEVVEAAYSPLADDIPDLPNVTDDLADELEEGVTWVADIDERVVGVLLSFAQEGGLNIANLAVHPDASGCGIGRALMNVAETFVRTEGGLELRLTTHRDIPNNVAFYEGLGWVVIERDGVKVFMIKDLTTS